MTEKKSALKKEVNIKFNNVRAAHYHDNNVWEHRSPLNKRVWRQYTPPPGPRNIFPGSSNNRTTVCSPGSPNDHFIQRSKDDLVKIRHINSDKWKLFSLNKNSARIGGEICTNFMNRLKTCFSYFDRTTHGIVCLL